MGRADRVYDFSGAILFDDAKPSDPKPGEPHVVHKVDKRTLRDAVVSVQPLIRECYERLGHHELPARG